MFRIVQWLSMLFLALLVFPAAAQSSDPITIQPPPPPPGDMVDVGGYNLHIYCTGEGSPTVILEPGFAKLSLNMRGLQEQIASTTRVCTYDHAGFGWSEAGTFPRTAEQLTAELETLLQNVDINPPYVLVAHSMGGFIARLFAAQHPEQVAGVVLAEATPPDFLTQITQAQTTPDGLEMALRATLQTAQTGAWTSQNLLPILSLTDDVPPEQREAFISLVTQPHYIETALSEWENRLANADAVIQAGTLDDIPLVILIGGNRLARLNEEDLLWLPAQVGQAGLSANARMMVALNSLHSIHLEQPDAILAALDWIIDQ